MAVDKQQRRWSALGGFAIALLVVLLVAAQVLAVVLDYTLEKYLNEVEPTGVSFIDWVDSEAYVPVYARSGARKSNKPLKTWMILAPLGVLVLGGAAAAMLMQPAEPAPTEPTDPATSSDPTTPPASPQG